MPRKTSFCNAALLRSDIKRYWPLLFLYVAVWVVILPMQILSASRECDGVADGIMTVLQLQQHNVIIRSIPASVVMSLLFGCFAAMAVWSYLMSGRTVGLMHALPVTRTQAFFSHVLSALGALTAGNVLIFLLTALCSAGFSYVDWAALVWWLYKKRPSETAGDAMSFRWLRPIARWSIGLCGGLGLGLFLRYTAFIDGGFACLLICQLVMGVICFFAAQMLLQKKFRIFNKRWWLETAAMVLVLAAVTVCVKLDITGYQHRVPDAEDVTSVRFSASYADFTADDPAAVESVISLHRAILEQYDETGERLENQTYLDTEGGPITRYVRVDYQLRNGTSLCREWRVSIVNGSDVHRLLTQLVNRTDSRESLIGIDSLARYGGVNAVISGYVRRYDTDEVAELTRQQAQDLASLALADAANSSGPLDPRSDDFYSYAKGYDMDIQLRVVIDRETSTTVPLNVPAFALRMQKFIDGLEFQVDGSSGDTTKAVDEILYD